MIIRNRVHGTLQTGREPDVDHFLEPEGLKPQLTRDEAHVALGAKQDKEHHDSGGELREYGRERRARDTEAEVGDKDKVEHNIT